MVYRMKIEELEDWVKTRAKPGDVAYYYDDRLVQSYIYTYKGPDDNPYWRLIFTESLEKFLEKLKVEESVMDKRCDNCKYFNGVTMSKITDYWCSHEKYSGTRIAAHTSCPEHEPKGKKATPFDGMKFYLKDKNTGELAINYICEDCGKEMSGAPYHWWLALPLNKNATKDATKVPGYHFRCEACYKKKEGKV